MPMENHFYQELKRNFTDFRNSLAQYILSIEILIDALEERKKLTNDPTYSMSIRILEQILSQMKQIRDRRIDTLDELFTIIKTDSVNKAGQPGWNEPPVNLWLNRDFLKTKQARPKEIQIEKPKGQQAKVKVHHKKPRIIPFDPTLPPPPWTPKK